MPLLLLLCLSFLPNLHAQAIPYSRPVETAPQADAIGGGYKTPAVQKPLPRDYWLQVMDVFLLAAAMGISVWLVLKRRSRKWAVALTIGSLAYFGFYREGCICPIGSIQNVAVALTDRAYSIPMVVTAALPAAARGRSVFRTRLLRRRVRARSDPGVGGAEAGAGAGAARPRSGTAEVRLSRARHPAGHQARPRARLPDLPLRPVRRILPPHRRTSHVDPGRGLSRARHVRGTALLPLPVPLWRLARVVPAPRPPRRHHHAGQRARLRAVRGSLPIRRHRPPARGAQRLPVLRALLRLMPARSIMKIAAWIAGGLTALCVAILFVDYALATRRAPKDDQLIKALQEQVKSDAALAPKLAGEQKRVTAARLARKSRDNALAWLLILVSSLFLTPAKRVVGNA